MNKQMQIILIALFLNCFLVNGYSARKIQIAEIVDWINKSDLILTARVDSVDQVVYETTIRELNDGWYNECDKGREVYMLNVDSICKGRFLSENDLISTPIYCISYSEKRKQGTRVTQRMVPHDTSWYRLAANEKKRIIILQYVDGYYEVLYSMLADKKNLEFVYDVIEQGEDYSFIKPIEEK